MSKAEWLTHWRAAGQHDTAGCAECAKRRFTKQANARAAERASALRSLGLKRTPYGWE